MRVLESPVTWIVVAAVLVVVALALIIRASLRRRRARRAAVAACPPPALESSHDAVPREPTPRAATPAPDTPEPAALSAGTPSLGTPSLGTPRPRRPDAAVVREAAKDRLLAVLLPDPEGAVQALATPEGEDGSGEAATALLRAGLAPAQVARLVGVDEDQLATVVARALGLLPGGQVAGGGVTTGENRTDDPGRNWANAGSSAGSTTPTTG